VLVVPPKPRVFPLGCFLSKVLDFPTGGILLPFCSRFVLFLPPFVRSSSRFNNFFWKYLFVLQARDSFYCDPAFFFFISGLNTGDFPLLLVSFFFVPRFSPPFFLFFHSVFFVLLFFPLFSAPRSYYISNNFFFFFSEAEVE